VCYLEDKYESSFTVLRDTYHSKGERRRGKKGIKNRKKVLRVADMKLFFV
jgi:hypothetical protein